MFFLVASGSDDHTVRLWDFATGKSLRFLFGHTNLVNSIAFSSDSNFLASGGRHGVLGLWQINQLNFQRV